MELSWIQNRTVIPGSTRHWTMWYLQWRSHLGAAAVGTRYCRGRQSHALNKLLDSGDADVYMRTHTFQNTPNKSTWPHKSHKCCTWCTGSNASTCYVILRFYLMAWYCDAGLMVRIRGLRKYTGGTMKFAVQKLKRGYKHTHKRYIRAA